MGRFAWVTVFAILCGTLALRPENSASLPAVLSGYVFLQNVYKNWVWKSSHKKSLNWTSFSSKNIFRAKGPFLAKIRMEFSNSPLPHPATWLADELMRLEHNLDGEKGKHCCATWTAKNPTPTYCTVPASSSCLAWGQKATVRDYSTVDDKMCEGKGRCWPASESARWPQPNLPDLEKWAEKCDSLGTGRTRDWKRRSGGRLCTRFLGSQVHADGSGPGSQVHADGSGQGRKGNGLVCTRPGQGPHLYTRPRASSVHAEWFCCMYTFVLTAVYFVCSNVCRLSGTGL